MKSHVIAYAITLPLFLLIDLVWLMWLGRQFYVAEIGSLLRTSPNLYAAAAFYLIYTLGLVVFAISGAVQDASPMQGLIYGALFGLIAYATYDLTNLAVLEGFTTRIALIDMAWGTLLSGVTAAIAVKLCLMLQN